MRLTFLVFSATVALSGCIAPTTWTDKGPGEITTRTGRETCYVDAHLIDGKRIEGELCAVPESNFFGDGEPQIELNTWHRKFLRALASETTKGVSRTDPDNVTYVLRCTPLIAGNPSIEVGRDCKVTANGQLLVAALIHWAK